MQHSSEAQSGCNETNGPIFDDKLGHLSRSGEKDAEKSIKFLIQAYTLV